MLDILLLVVIAALIARAVWKLIGLLENLFAYLGVVYSATRTSPKSSQVNKEKHSDVVLQLTEKQVQTKNAQKLSKEQLTNKNKREEQGRSIYNSQKRRQVQQNQQNQQLKNDQTRKQYKQQPQEISLRKQERSESNQKTTKIKEYQMIINSLRQQIALYHREKQMYIQRIQEIIQHVVNETELEEGQSRNSTEDDQLGAINNLKHQLIAVQHKICEQKEVLTKNFEKEKEELVEYYEQKIRVLQGDIAQKASLYQQTINQVTQKIQQMERNGNHSPDITEQKLQEEQRSHRKNQLYDELVLQLDQQKQAKSIEKQKYESQIQSLNLQFSKYKEELEIAQKQLTKAQNNCIQQQVKFQAEVNSLRLSEDVLRAELESIKSQQVRQKSSPKSLNESSVVLLKKQIESLEQKFTNEKKGREQVESKLQDAHQQLKFCQEQLKNTRDSQTQLKNKLTKNQRFKRKVEQSEPSMGRNKTQENSSQKQRQFSPCFPGEISEPPKRLSPSVSSQNKKLINTSPYSRQISTKSPSHVSTILVHQDRRSNGNNEKTVACSTIIEGGIIGEVYLGETDILNESQRNFIINEVSAVKKITVKKTRIMYSSRQKGNKSIHQFVLGAPNIILVAELQNHKIVGAFTQNAFSREKKFTKSSIVSKAMIFDVSKQVYITNEPKGQIIRCEQNALIWGNNEFVVNCQEPFSISINLNCEGGVYPSYYSSEQFFDSHSKVMRVVKLQVHRVFLG